MTNEQSNRLLTDYLSLLQSGGMKLHPDASGVFLIKKDKKIVMKSEETENFMNRLRINMESDSSLKNIKRILDVFNSIINLIEKHKELDLQIPNNDYDVSDDNIDATLKTLKNTLQIYETDYNEFIYDDDQEVPYQLRAFTPEMRIKISTLDRVNSDEKKILYLSNVHKTSIDNGNIHDIQNVQFGEPAQKESKAVTEERFRNNCIFRIKDIPKEKIIQWIPYILFDPADNVLPLPNQFLICEKSTTTSQIKAFFDYIRHYPKDKRRNFIILNNYELNEEPFQCFVELCQKFMDNPSEKVKLFVISEQNDDERLKNLLMYVDILKDCDSNFDDSYKSLIDNLFNCFVYYTNKPQVGKTQQILNKVYDAKGQYNYHHCIISSGTPLSILVDFFNTVKYEDNKETFIHFDVDGNINMNFTYYLMNIIFFNVLSDHLKKAAVFGQNATKYKKPTIFFEIGSKVYPPNNDRMFKNDFPLASFMKDGYNPRVEFSLDEYVPVNVNGKITIEKRENARSYLPRAAALVYMTYYNKTKIGEETYFIDTNNKRMTKINKSKEHLIIMDKDPGNYSYKDFKYAFNGYVKFFEENPAQIEEYIKNMLFKDYEGNQFSTICNVCQIINSSSGPFLSQNQFRRQCDFKQNLLQLSGINIINLGLTSGFEYTQQENDEKEDTRRLNLINEHIGAIKSTIVVTNVNEDSRLQEFICISQKQDYKISNMLAEAGIEYTDNMKEFVRTFFDIQKLENLKKNRHGLFSAAGAIFNMRSIETIPFAKILFLKMLEDMTNDEKQKIIDNFWNEDKINAAIANRNNNIALDFSDDANCYDFVNNVKTMNINDFKDGNRFLLLDDCYKKINGEIDNNKDPFVRMLRKFVFTPANIIKLGIIAVRCSKTANVPTILSGETGIGKTFTINFISKIIARHIMLEKLVVNSGTTSSTLSNSSGATSDEMLEEFVEERLMRCKHERGKTLGKKIFYIIKEQTRTEKLLSSFLKEFMEYKRIKENQDGYTNDEIDAMSIENMKEYIEKFVDSIFNEPNKKEAFMITDNIVKQNIIDHLSFKLEKFEREVRKESLELLFFFDEVNVAHCQWYLKSLIVDRYFKGNKLPYYVRFIGAINPRVEVPENFKKQIAFDTEKIESSLIYKVQKMPESFLSFILPFDPNRDDPNTKQNPEITKEGVVCDFEQMVQGIVDERMAIVAEKAKKDTAAMGKFFGQLNISACRLLRKIYGVPSFCSLRDPTKTSELLNWFYDELKSYNDNNERLKRAIIHSICFIYYYKLSESQEHNDRKTFRDEIIKVWNNYCGLLNIGQLHADDIDKTILQKDQEDYAKKVFGENSGIDINLALRENAWATYVCCNNNIALWIFGPPGLSKSLSVNTVLNKMLQENTVLKQMYYCSKESTTQSLKASAKSLVYSREDNKKLVLIIEEMGSAQESVDDPLKVIHQWIDEGFITEKDRVPILLIGLSNKSVDCAKLNRGVWILREKCKDLKSTLETIYKFHAKQQIINEDIDKLFNDLIKAYNQIKNKNITLRDYYNLAKSIAKSGLKQLNKLYIKNMFDLPNNESNDLRTKILKNHNPSFKNLDYWEMILPHKSDVGFIEERHLMLVTKDRAAFNIIYESMKNEDPVVIFGETFNNMKRKQWVLDDLLAIKKAMEEGKFVIIYGTHPCFDSLYDVFNQNYTKQNGKYQTYMSLIGIPELVTIDKNFRCYVILNEKEFDAQPTPFKSRFEKHSLDYTTYKAEDPEIERTKVLQKYSKYCPPYLSEQYINSMLNIMPENQDNDAKLLSLGYLPSVYYYSKNFDDEIQNNDNDINEEEDQIEEEEDYEYEEDDDDEDQNEEEEKDEYPSWLHTNFIQIINNINKISDENLSLYNSIFGQQKDNTKGCNAILVTPFIPANIKECIGTPDDEKCAIEIVDIDRILNLDSCIESIKGKESDKVVVLLYSCKSSSSINMLPILQYKLAQLRKDITENRQIHFFIAFSVSAQTASISLTQSIEWPVIAVDTLPSKIYESDFSKFSYFPLFSNNTKTKIINIFYRAQLRKVVTQNVAQKIIDIVNDDIGNFYNGVTKHSTRIWKDPPPSVFQALYLQFRNIIMTVANHLDLNPESDQIKDHAVQVINRYIYESSPVIVFKNDKIDDDRKDLFNLYPSETLDYQALDKILKRISQQNLATKPSFKTLIHLIADHIEYIEEDIEVPDQNDVKKIMKTFFDHIVSKLNTLKMEKSKWQEYFHKSFLSLREVSQLLNLDKEIKNLIVAEHYFDRKNDGINDAKNDGTAEVMIGDVINNKEEEFKKLIDNIFGD